MFILGLVLGLVAGVVGTKFLGAKVVAEVKKVEDKLK